MKYLFNILIVGILLAACDSGDILDKEYSVQTSGKVVKLTATINNISNWNDNYNIALAAFSETSKYAIAQRVIPESTPSGQRISVTLENLSSDISTVELTLTNKLRKRILTLASMNISDFEEGGDTIRMDLGILSLDNNGCIQKGILDIACIQCHGGNGRKAGNLDLTEGNSAANLFDIDAQSSVAGQGYRRIVSGNPDESLLYKILNPGGEDILHYNHTEVLSSQFKNNLEEVKTLIAEWIKEN